MGISTGLILLIVGAAGCVGCIAGLMVCKRKWNGQREQLLAAIKSEDRSI